METTGLEVEFQVTAIRCGQCNRTGYIRTVEEAGVFLTEHAQHSRLIYISIITAPPELVDGRPVELEFSQEAGR